MRNYNKSLMITEALHKKIKTESEKQGRNISTVVENIITEYLRKEKD